MKQKSESGHEVWTRNEVYEIKRAFAKKRQQSKAGQGEVVRVRN